MRHNERLYFSLKIGKIRKKNCVLQKTEIVLYIMLLKIHWIPSILAILGQSCYGNILWLYSSTLHDFQKINMLFKPESGDESQLYQIALVCYVPWGI